MDPHASYLLLRGMKTLELRIHQQNRTAEQLAQFLHRHPKIARVWYPTIPDHPDYEVARKQNSKGWGGVLSFEVSFQTMSLEKEEVRKTPHGVDHTMPTKRTPVLLCSRRAYMEETWMFPKILPVHFLLVLLIFFLLPCFVFSTLTASGAVAVSNWWLWNFGFPRCFCLMG